MQVQQSEIKEDFLRMCGQVVSALRSGLHEATSYAECDLILFE